MKQIFIRACDNNNIIIAKLFVEILPNKFYISIEDDEIVDYFVLKTLPIDSITLTIKSTIDDSICVICRDATSDIQTNCLHLFCNDCISQWYSKNESCPYCRSELTSFNRVVIETD